jgi:hypothetical protein
MTETNPDDSWEVWLTVWGSSQEECDRNPGYMVGDGDGAVGHCKASCGTCLARLTSGEHLCKSCNINILIMSMK